MWLIYFLIINKIIYLKYKYLTALEITLLSLSNTI